MRYIIIGLVVILVGGLLYLYLGPASNNNQQTVVQETTPKPTPTVHATVAPPPATSNLQSIANLHSGGATQQTPSSGAVPQAGPADDLAFAAGFTLIGGGGTYYYLLKSRLKKAWRNVDVA